MLSYIVQLSLAIERHVWNMRASARAVGARAAGRHRRGLSCRFYCCSARRKISCPCFSRAGVWPFLGHVHIECGSSPSILIFNSAPDAYGEHGC